MNEAGETPVWSYGKWCPLVFARDGLTDVQCVRKFWVDVAPLLAGHCSFI